MKIMKFGGSSIENPDRIKNVMEIIIKAKSENNNVAVVFSAFGGVTDELIKISNMAAVRDNNYVLQSKNGLIHRYRLYFSNINSRTCYLS